MNKSGIIAFFVCILLANVGQSGNPLKVDGILYSQLGYDRPGMKRIIIRDISKNALKKDASFEIYNEKGEMVLNSGVKYWGEKWNTHWWIVDFSSVKEAGSYRAQIESGNQSVTIDDLKIGKNLLWNETWKTVALTQLHDRIEWRDKNARIHGEEHAQGGGWQDCGGYLREVNSHATMLVGLYDLLETSHNRISTQEQVEIREQIQIGLDYIAYCQDKAKELKHGEGAVIHHWPKHTNVITGDVAKSAMVFARGAKLLKATHPKKAEEYLYRAQIAFKWLDENGPNHHCGGTDFKGKVQPDDGFDKWTHGAPQDFVRPVEWMTRDLVMMVYAAVELYYCQQYEYKEKAKYYASEVLKRQIGKKNAEGKFYGHFRLYENCDFSEKAFTHHSMAYDAGSTFPHYIIPLIEMVKLWPEDKISVKIEKAVRDFAYGYFYPACTDNPFNLLPTGYFKGQGLLVFSGLWHGMNGSYGSAAALAYDLTNFLKDRKFEDIAVSNLQWIIGVNSGIREGDEFKPKSMIYGIGKEHAGSWTKIPGTICNGFDADGQFVLKKPLKETDGPNVFTDEGWITHSGGWLSAITRCQEF